MSADFFDNQLKEYKATWDCLVPGSPIFQVVIDAFNSVVVETGPKTSLGCDFSN
jgi:hypothetical protein